MNLGGRLGRTSLLTLVGLALMAAPVTASRTPAHTGPGAELVAAWQSLRTGQTAAATRQLDAAVASIPAAGLVAAELRSGDDALATRQLALLLEAVSPPPGTPAPRAVGRALTRVYRDPQLADLGHPSGGGNSLLSQLANFLRQLALSLFHAVGNTVWVALALLVLILGGTMTAVLLRRSRGRLQLPAQGSDDTAKGPLPMRPERLFAKAEQLGAEGRFAESVRASFQALLLSASDRRVLDIDPSWTNSELLRVAARVGSLEPTLRPLVAQFNRVIYGGEDPGREGCSHFTTACRAAAAGLSQ